MGRDHIDRQFEREEDRLSKAYGDGTLSREEYHAEMQALQRDARDALREAEAEEHERIRREFGGW
jgi:hypothetical protein